MKNILIILSLLLSTQAMAQKFLRCHTLESGEFPDSFAFILGSTDMMAQCEDFSGHEYALSFHGKAYGAGGSLTGDVEMTEDGKHTLDAKRYFMLSCPFSRKSKFEETQTFYFSTVEAGVFFDVMAGAGINKRGAPCLITGGGSVMIGGLAQFTELTISPIIQL